MDDYDSPDQSPPEVTISPADNGHVVRWHQRSSKKRTPSRDGQLGTAGAGGESDSAPAAHSARTPHRGSSRRRRSRIGGRR